MEGWGVLVRGGGEEGRVMTVLLRHRAEVRVEERRHRMHRAGVGKVALEPLATSQKAAIVKHVLTGRVERPVIPLPRVARLARDLQETVVEAEVVSYAVLPCRELLPVVAEPVHDELADSAQRQSFLRRLQDGHGDEGDVGVGRLHRATFLPRRAAFVRLGAVLSRAQVIDRVPVQRVPTAAVSRLTFVHLHRVLLLKQVNVNDLVIVFLVVRVR